MADETTAPAETEAAEQAPAGQPSEAPTEEATDWKAEARKWEKRAKENRASLEAITGERDQAAEQVKALTGERDALSTEVEGFRTAAALAADAREVAKEAGLSPDVLRGSTREELEAHAKALTAYLADAPSAPVVPTQGARPSHVTGDTNREAARALFGRH